MILAHSRQLPDRPTHVTEFPLSAILGVVPEEFCKFSSVVPALVYRGALPAATLESSGPFSHQQLHRMESL